MHDCSCLFFEGFSCFPYPDSRAFYLFGDAMNLVWNLIFWLGLWRKIDWLFDIVGGQEKIKWFVDWLFDLIGGVREIILICWLVVWNMKNTIDLLAGCLICWGLRRIKLICWIDLTIKKKLSWLVDWLFDLIGGLDKLNLNPWLSTFWPVRF